jgi:rfaE bifunctional protein nucleotidyltransferase chain/domain
MGKNKMIYAAGVFDLLHYAHVWYLQRAKALGDLLVVGLIEDEGVKKYKGKLPIMNYGERYEVVRALSCVDYVVRQDDTDPTETLKKLKKEHNWIFDIMVRADDYKGVPQGTKFIEENGGKVVRVPYCKEISSTKIKKRLSE